MEWIETAKADETLTLDGKKTVAVDIQQGTGGGHFEEMRSLEQNLTFENCAGKRMGVVRRKEVEILLGIGQTICGRC